MSDLLLVVAVAAVTYGSRVVLMAIPLEVPGGLFGRFLDVFPLALFIAIATSGLVAPEGTPEMSPGLAAAAGGGGWCSVVQAVTPGSSLRRCSPLLSGPSSGLLMQRSRTDTYGGGRPLVVCEWPRGLVQR